MAKRSRLESRLELQLRALKAPPPETEYRFAAHYVGGGPGVRKRLKDAGLKNWAFDFAWPDRMLAAEVEGGAYVNGRHTRGTGFEEDCLKYHHAMRLGWTVYRCEAKLIGSGDAARLLTELLQRG